MEKYIGKEAKSSDDLGTYQLPSHHLCVYRKKEAMTVRSLGLLTMRVRPGSRTHQPQTPHYVRKAPMSIISLRASLVTRGSPAPGCLPPTGKFTCHTFPWVALPHPGHCLEDAGSRGAGHCL